MKKPTKWGILKFASFLPTLYFLVLSFSFVDMSLISNASFMEMNSTRNIKKLVVMAAICCLLGEFNLWFLKPVEISKTGSRIKSIEMNEKILGKWQKLHDKMVEIQSIIANFGTSIFFIIFALLWLKIPWLKINLFSNLQILQVDYLSVFSSR